MKWIQILAVSLVALASCRTSATGPYSSPAESARDTSAAEKLNRKAAEFIDTDPSNAESLLREALTKDVFCGPAHNNLGVVFLNQGKLYEAANEFEWARKLLPDSADPRVNLAITMERAGRTEDAFRSYLAALEVAPNCISAEQGAARNVISSGRTEARLAGWLKRIALEGETAEWRDWARARLVAR